MQGEEHLLVRIHAAAAGIFLFEAGTAVPTRLDQARAVSLDLEDGLGQRGGRTRRNAPPAA